MAEPTLVIGTRNLSSWSLRPWLVLRQLDLPFTEVEIELDRPDTGAKIRSHSAAARVPVLHHGDLTVWDSLAIVEYLADLYPEAGVWPTDRVRRAEARAAAAEMHAGFATLRERMPMAFRDTLPPPSSSPALEADIARVIALWTDLRQRHAGAGDFLFGAFSATDAFYAPVVSRFRTYGVPLEGAAATYAATMRALPAMAEWLEGC